jgi:hypothetical protein
MPRQSDAGFTFVAEASKTVQGMTEQLDHRPYLRHGAFS